MAALTGSLTADFSGFVTEVDKSVTKLHELERAGTGTANAVGTFADSLSVADKTLAQAGIHIGPQIQAMRELSAAVGKTVTEFGLLNSTVAMAAAFKQGWDIGRMIADWLDLDEKIGNATASLLGWGDVAAQRAGASMDVLNRATQIAGRTITDFNEALQIIKRSNDAMSSSLTGGAERWRQWTTEIQKLRDRGDLAEIDKELKNGTSTIKQLSVEYGISAEALQYYSNRAKENSAILEKWHANEAAALEKTRKAQEELNQLGGGWRKTLETIAPATAAVVTQYLAMGGSLDTIATAQKLTLVQVQALDKAWKEQTATLVAQEPALGTLEQFYAGLAPAITEAGKAQQFFDQQLVASLATITEEVAPAIEKLETTFKSVTEAARPGGVGSGVITPGGTINTGGISFPAGGVTLEQAFQNYSARFGGNAPLGMIGGGPAPDFLSWALKMGYAQQGVTNNINLNGVLGTDDPQTRDLVKRLVGDAFADTMRNQRLLSSA